jgi:cell division transport system permease protein
MTWLRLHGYALAEALRRLARQPIATATSVVVLGLVLSLPIVAGIGLRSLGEATARLDTDPQVHVFMGLDATDADVKRVEAALREAPEAGKVRFVSRADALAELEATTHLAELLATLDRNPLPHAFTVHLRSAQAERVLALKRTWAKLPKVDEVVADLEWTRRLAGWIRLAERLVVGLAVFLGLAVILVVGHLVRLQVLGRREEIELSRLIGAGPADVSRPFLYFGALQGLLAGATAVAVSAALTLWAGAELQALTPTYIADFKLILPSRQIVAAIIGGCALIGVVAAALAVGREARTLSSHR